MPIPANDSTSIPSLVEPHPGDGPTVTGDDAGRVVIGEHPGGWRPDRTHGGQRQVDDVALGLAVHSHISASKLNVVCSSSGAHVRASSSAGVTQASDTNTRAPPSVSAYESATVRQRRRMSCTMWLVQVRGAGQHVHYRLSGLRVDVEVGQARCLGHRVGDVDPKPVDTTIEPEPQDRIELLGYGRVIPVPVRLLWSEQVQVPLPGRARRDR